MTTQDNKTEKIREIIIKAVPEAEKQCWRCEGSGYLQNSLEKAEGFVGSVVCDEDLCKDGIIGRPITLFDIKQCLVYYGYTDIEFNEIAKLWTAPDNLNDQTKILINKLYDYIKNKNN